MKFSLYTNLTIGSKIPALTYRLSCGNRMVLVNSSMDVLNSNRNYFTAYLIAGEYFSREIFAERIMDQMQEGFE